MKWPRVFMVVGAIFLVSCQSRCGIPEPPVGVEGAHDLAGLVPGDAHVVAYGERLADLLWALEQISEQVPVGLPQVGDRRQWEEIGAKVDGPGAAFYASGQLVVAGWVDPQVGEQVQDGWAAVGAQREAVKLGRRGWRGWRESDDEGRWSRWLASDRRRLVAGWAVEEGAEPLMEQIWELEDEGRQVHPGKVDFLKQVGEGGQQASLHGVVRGELAMGRLPGAGHAGSLRDLLASSVGEVFWATKMGEDGEVVLDLWTPGEDGASLAVGLGEAQGQLPDIGGLARPGVPAIIRFSADPKRLLPLLKSALSRADSERLEEQLQMMEEELQVDIEGEFIDNLMGQFAVVIYGLEESFFELEGVEFLASLFRLQSTREALLMPIKDRRRMEDFLNILTQISQGSLRRQALEHTVQYAWFDEGSLNWAVILSDEYLLFVDSSVAFGYALSWERSPSPLSDVLERRGVGELMESTRGVGAYFDLATLRGVLLEGGEPALARWLEGMEALSVESDIEGRKERARVRLWLSSTKAMGSDED